MSTKGLDEFIANYAGGDEDASRIILDLDMDANPRDLSPFIIVRYKGNVVILNPMVVDDYLDVDVHPFKDGKDATVGVFGMSNGKRWGLGAGDAATGTTSQGWASTNMVALLVGKQGTE